MGVNQIS